MEKTPSSIFNDVLGPVMRGPSSSHVAAASRIGKLIYMASNGGVKSIIVDFDINGSLAESYNGHGSDIGLASGLLGLDVTDVRVPEAIKIAKENDVKIEFRISDYGAIHPNNYKLTVTDKNGKNRLWEAISTGGGMIKIEKLNDFHINVNGDFYELLLITNANLSQEFQQYLDKESSNIENLNIIEDGKGRYLINLKSRKPFSEDDISKIKDRFDIEDCIYIQPVLPILGSKDISVPFSNAVGATGYANKTNKKLWELACLYESQRGGITEEEVFNQMEKLVDIMEESVKIGLSGTYYKDRILQQQSHLIEEGNKDNKLIPVELISTMVKNVTAIMEVKSSMGVIIAAPTAGACGALPGTLIAAKDTFKMDKSLLVKGMLSASLIGIFISEGSTFAAEVAGCQAECGSASGMAAAGLCEMFNGTAKQCIDAASIALQSITGLVCDPIANRVEAPCLNKNIMAGSNAISCATMALAGFDKVIPLDETIGAIKDIGNKLPLELRCTYGGLGKTKTSNEIRKRLEVATKD